MKTLLKVLVGIGILVLIVMNLSEKATRFWDHGSRTSRADEPIREITEKRYTEFSEGAFLPGELPFAVLGEEKKGSFLLVDGKEVPAGTPFGIAKIGGESLPVYTSSLRFFRRVDPEEAGRERSGETGRVYISSGIEVRDISVPGGTVPTSEALEADARELAMAGFAPAVLLPSGERVIPTGDLNVIPEATVTANQLVAAAKALGLKVARAATETDEWWLLQTESVNSSEIFAAANALAKAVPLRFAEPDLIREVKRRKIPTDTLFKEQWHLRNTAQTGGTAGADISAEKAWDITVGKSDVIVAIFDDGFDVGHTDLPSTSMLVHARDFVRKSSNVTPMDNDPNDPDNHGTAVWGLMAARYNNRRGVAGVSPGVKFMLLRTPLELSERGIADAIRWAADHGAHVMSNSWGYTDPGSVVKSALAYARKSGRGGKGTLVFFASGNENVNIGKTNDLSNNSNVLAIGATSHQDKRTTYSNFGDGLFAVAPAGYSASAGLVSTDRTGSAGYNAGSYTSDKGNQFDGTSGACPIAAGVAALVFSVDPSMTAEDVIAILRTTADKVQKTTAAYNASGHSLKYGFGRLNARAAVERANGGPPPAPASVGNSIAGSVKNKATGQPIADALVTLSSGVEHRGATFQFENLPIGKYTVVATAENYKRSSRTVTLSEGSSRTINFSLVEVPRPDIVVTVRRVNNAGSIVFAQGVKVSLTGLVNKRSTTGWGETAGKAKFYSLPAGTYKVTWNRKSASVTVVQGQTAYIDIGP